MCSDVPQVMNDRLVVSWTFTHTGGEALTSVDVFFSTPGTPRQPFSSVPGAELEGLGVTVREDSIPLPEAGLTYQFSVRAGNGQGESEVDCPSLLLTTGGLHVWVEIFCTLIYTTASLVFIHPLPFPHTHKHLFLYSLPRTS